MSLENEKENLNEENTSNEESDATNVTQEDNIEENNPVIDEEKVTDNETNKTEKDNDDNFEELAKNNLEETPVIIQPKEEESEEQGEYNPTSTQNKTINFISSTNVLNGVDFPTYTETLRTDFNKSIKKGKGVNIGLNIGLLCFSIATVVFAFIGMSKTATWLTALLWTSLAIALIFLICSLVFSSQYKKRNNGLGYKYEKDFTDAYIDYLYLNRSGISGMQYSIEGNAKDADVINTHYWATINYISSRLRIVSLYNDLEFTDTELLMSCPRYSTFVKDIEEYFAKFEPQDSQSLQEEKQEDLNSAPVSKDNPNPTEKKEERNTSNSEARSPELGAYGHFFTYNIKSHITDGIIVVRTVSDTYLPTNVKGYRRFNEFKEALGEDFLVLATSKEFATKILTNNVIEALKNININSSTLDYFISFNHHGCYVLMNSTEDLINVPTNWKADYSKYEQFSNNITEMFKIFNEIKEIEEN